MTLALVILGMTPCLIWTWRKPAPGSFMLAATHACLTSFLLGFHVHEKAVLMATVPLGLLAAKCCRDQLSNGSSLADSSSDDRPFEGTPLDKPASRSRYPVEQTASSSDAAQQRQQQTSSSSWAPDMQEDRGSAKRSDGQEHEQSTNKDWSAIDTSGNNSSLQQDFLILATAGHYGLLPLLFTLQEYPIKASLTPLDFLLCNVNASKLRSQQTHGTFISHHP